MARDLMFLGFPAGFAPGSATGFASGAADGVPPLQGLPSFTTAAADAHPEDRLSGSSGLGTFLVRARAEA